MAPRGRREYGWGVAVVGSPEVPLEDPSLLEGEAVARSLGVDPRHGLTGGEAARRLAQDGPNELTPGEPEPLWHRIVRQFADPLVYLLLIAIVVALGAWLVEGGHGVPVDAVVIAAVVVANAAIGFAQEAKADAAVAALADMTAAMSTVVRDGRPITIPSSGLVRGDLLQLAEGDAVGADARIVTATGLRVQEAPLTGESGAVTKEPRPLGVPAVLGDRVNMVFKGTGVVQGVGTAVVTATGMSTEMGAIAVLLDQTEAEPSPMQREIAAVSRRLGIAVLVIAVVVMAATALVGGVHSLDDVVAVLLLGVSLAVAAVPEGLPAILSLVLAVGVRAMARRNAVIKRMASVETLGSATVICSDKTGTLTRNEMTLRAVITPIGAVELTGTGYEPAGVPRVVAAPDDPAAVWPGAGPHPNAEVIEAATEVVVGGSLANNASVGHDGDGWRVQGDPTEAAFLVAAHKLDGALDRVGGFERTAEIPFTSERKMMSALGALDGSAERHLFTKGAPDVLLDHCSWVRVGQRVVRLDASGQARALDEVERLSRRGYRTIGVAYRPVDPTDPGPEDLDDSAEDDLVYLGVAGIIDPPRDEALAAVAEAHRAGIRIVMITGDHPSTASTVAADLGIVGEGAGVLTGLELDELDDDEFAHQVARVSVFARVAPSHKLRIVDALQAKGQVVAMTGDGVNDAPALKSADIGVAMGVTGTEVTKEAGTMILGDDDFATIVAAVRQGRRIFDNITTFLRYLLSSNMGEVVTVFFGVVLAGVIGLTGSGEGLVLPLLATQILWINLVTDSAPALALGVDPGVDDVMARPPRRPGERILDGQMWATVLGVGVVMGASTLLTLDIFLPGGLVAGTADLTTARTAAFTTLVFAQVANVLNSRSATASAFRHLFVNRWLWGALALAVLLQVAVVEIPVLQAAFGTASLSPAQWGVTAAMASVVLWTGEIAKLLRRWLRAR